MAYELGKPSTRIHEMEATVFWLEATDTGDVKLMAALKGDKTTQSCIVQVTVYGELILRRYVSTSLGLKTIPADGFHVKVAEDELHRATEDLLVQPRGAGNPEVDRVVVRKPRPYPHVRREGEGRSAEEDL